MSADVSRALAKFAAATGIGQDAARALARTYSGATSVSDLPAWIVEADASPEA